MSNHFFQALKLEGNDLEEAVPKILNRISKSPDGHKLFGKGNIEGVISSETSNNAATGAAMIPLLALGLPGGALTAMMVAVFQMHDLEPGPLVFYNSPELIWIVFAAMFYANLSILFVGLIRIL